MATTRKKTTSGARSGTKTGGSRSGTASRSRASAKGAKRPVRREVGGVAMLLLALIVLVSYFTGDGWLINLIPKACKGLFGVGYYIAVPALLAAAWVLLTHRGRPVALRTACALLTPYLFGGVWHLLFCRLDLSDAAGLFPTLWETGYELTSGGVLSGASAHGFVAVLGKPASVIVFVVLLAILLMVTFQVTPAQLLEMWRERRDYDEDDYEDPPPPPAKRPAPQRPKKQAAKARSVIDIPLDGAPLGAPPPTAMTAQPEERPGFFRPREKEQLTPADVLAPAEPEPPLPEPEIPPVPAPLPDPLPEASPLPEPDRKSVV